MKRSVNIYIILLFILLLVSGIFFAQNKNSNFINPSLRNYGLVIQNWDNKNGLPSNRIFDIIQDKYGFIWLGTDNGLVRFDGSEFKVYNGFSYPQLKNESVSELSLSQDGSLWFKNGYNNLIKKEGNNFFNINYKQKNIKYILRTAIDSTNILWVGTFSNGLFYFANNKLSRFTQNFSAKHISALTVDNRNNLWVGTKDFGVYRIKNGEVVNHIKPEIFNSSSIKYLFVDSLKKILVCTNSGLDVLTFSKFQKKYLLKKISNYRINSIVEDSNKNIWLATNKHGLLIYRKKKLLNFTTVNGLSDDNITNIIANADGIWISTFNGGLNYIKRAQVFTFAKKHGLKNSYVNSIYENPDGSLLIGTNIGIYKLEKLSANGVIKRLNILPDNHIFAIKRDKENNLVVGTRYGGLYLFKKNKIINYTTANGLKSDFIRSVFFDDDGKMWVGTNGGGVSVFSSKGIKNFTRKNGLSSELISFIHKSGSGQYWIGTSGGGINIIDSGKVVKVLDDKNGLSGNIISSIYEEMNGTIWLTINGGGLTMIKGNIIRNLTTKDGLYSNKLLNLALDKLGQFWISTPKGIFSVKKNNLLRYLTKEDTNIKYQLYGKAGGMLNERCVGASPQTLLTASNGIIYFSTFNGMVEIDPEFVSKRKTNLKVYLEAVLVNYEKQLLSKISVIEPGAERIEFKFGAIDFDNPNELEYHYKLVGLEKKWESSGKLKSVSYSHLPYGQYKFLFKAVNKGINKESNIGEVQFYLKPFFYQTVYFKFLLALLLLGIIVGLTRYFYLRKYREELRLIELENAVEKERIRISKDMHDDIGSVLTKINLLSEIAKRDITNKEKLTSDLREINIAGRKVADTLDEIVWALNPRNDNLENLISYIVKFAEEYLLLAGIELKLSIPEEIPDKEIGAEFRHNLFMVIKETLNNIVKYSGTKCVNMPIEIINNKLVFELTNKGKKIDFCKINKFSNGIINMKSRIKDIGGEYIIENFNEGVKTKIILNF